MVLVYMSSREKSADDHKPEGSEVSEDMKENKHPSLPGKIPNGQHYPEPRPPFFLLPFFFSLCPPSHSLPLYLCLETC